MGNLRKKLLTVGYRVTEELERQVLTALETRPCPGSFLSGPAGAGKTFLAESVAQVQERNTFFFQAFPGCRKEELFHGRREEAIRLKKIKQPTPLPQTTP